MDWTGPILDNHMHLDVERGNGLPVVEDFVHAGGTHLLIVNKPSWWYGINARQADDFSVGFDATVETVTEVSAYLPGRAWAVLGVHPGLISRLYEDGLSPAEAGKVMKEGIDRAAVYVSRGDALALKSGRPHYPVASELQEVSNEVLRHTFDRASEVGCAVQLHTESGESFDDLERWARRVGLDPTRVVKHYAEGPIEGAIPSVICRREALEPVVSAEVPFLMETDFLDDPDRPGAVLGTKTVPRRVGWILETVGTDPLERAHVETPRTVYGVDTRDTLDD